MSLAGVLDMGPESSLMCTSLWAQNPSTWPKPIFPHSTALYPTLCHAGPIRQSGGAAASLPFRDGKEESNQPKPTFARATGGSTNAPKSATFLPLIFSPSSKNKKSLPPEP
jgi:hypothetical protein